MMHFKTEVAPITSANTLLGDTPPTAMGAENQLQVDAIDAFPWDKAVSH
jgi:hypothetical protein